MWSMGKIQRGNLWRWSILAVLLHQVLIIVLFVLLDTRDNPNATQNFIKDRTFGNDDRDLSGTSHPTDPEYAVSTNLLVFFPTFGLQVNGSNKHIDTEKFVIRSWIDIAQLLSSRRKQHGQGPSVRIINLVGSKRHCYPLFEDKTYSSSYNCQALPKGCSHPQFGIPTMDCIFSEAIKAASPSEILFYANSDMIFPFDTLSTIASIQHHIQRQNGGEDFVVVGRRTEIEAKNFPSKYSQATLRDVVDHARRNGTIYSPYGLDYFIMPPQLFPTDFPPFLLGRWRWDNALLTHFITNDIPTVDASETILAIHVGLTTDFGPTQYNTRIGSDFNDKLVNEKWGNAFYFGRTGNTRFRHSVDNVSKSLVLMPNNDLTDPNDVIPLRRGLHASANQPNTETLVHLLIVYPGHVEHGLKLACIAKNSPSSTHYTFLTMDDFTYNYFANIYPGSVILEKATQFSGEGAVEEWQRTLRTVMTRLIKNKAAVIVTNATSPIWFPRHAQDSDDFAVVIRELIQKCDVTLFNEDLVSVRPTAEGLFYLEMLNNCASDTLRHEFVEDIPQLTDQHRHQYSSTKAACIEGLQRDKAFLGEKASICHLQKYLPPPQPLPTDLKNGRTWMYNSDYNQCIDREIEAKIGAREEAPIHHAIRTTQQPVETKLHAVIVVGNPCGLTSRYKLAQDTVYRLEQYEEDHVVVYVVELAYGDQPFQVTKKGHPRHLQLRTEIPMWHKENMVNLAVERLLPPDWKAMAWIDGDVEFESANWAVDTLKLLNGHKDVVQLFSHAVFMDAVGNTLQVYTGYAYNFVRGRSYEGVGSDLWHPGFGWAYSRKAYDQAGGIYEREISGHGDGVIAHCFRGGYDWNTYWFGFSSQGHREAVLAYNTSCSGLQMGYTPGVVRHYFHGSYANRKYMERRQIFDNFTFNPLQDLKRDEGTGVLVPTAMFPVGLMAFMYEDCKNKKADDGDVSLFSF